MKAHVMRFKTMEQELRNRLLLVINETYLSKAISWIFFMPILESEKLQSETWKYAL